MVRGGGSNSERGGVADDFTTALTSLKHRGSSLLVVGGVPAETYEQASTQMLGDPTATPSRRRVLVVPDAAVDDAKRRLRETGPLDAEWTRIVAYDAEARSTAVHQPDTLTETSGAHAAPSVGTKPQTADPVVERVSGDIAALGQTLSAVIDEFDDAADGLDPAELRLGFDLLPTLLAEHDVDVVFRFCHVLTNQIRGVNGMGHFWLSQAREDETVRTFDTLFDATIELRLDDQRVEQRWHFRDSTLVSDWLPVHV